MPDNADIARLISQGDMAAAARLVRAQQDAKDAKAAAAAPSTSTAAPAALAFSDGLKLLTKGTAAKPAPTAPAQPDAINHVRLPVSTGVLLMEIL